MLSLVVILCVIVIIVLSRKRKESSKPVIVVLAIIIFLSIFSEAIWCEIIWQNDTGDLQRTVDILTQMNGKMTEWREEITDKPVYEPEFLNLMDEYLQSKIAKNNQEIERCIRLQEKNVPLYKWLVYFG